MIASMIVAAGLAAAGRTVPARSGPRLAYPSRADGATHVAAGRPLPPFDVPPEPAPTETLAEALDAAYRSAPALQQQRYLLRATDEDYALALAELRPTAELQLTGGYSQTVPGRLTNAKRSLVDQLTEPTISSNSIGAELVVEQPLSTGGRAVADRGVARAAVAAGRAELRGTEGDLLLEVITRYADIRRDTRALALRAANLKQLDATLAEVIARREAGELTQTDIAQAETQLNVARAQYNSAYEQLEQGRAAYAAVVGRDPGTLAPEPTLPGAPADVDAAFTIAARLNPELARAIAGERASRGRIAVAAAEGQPRLSLRGSATLNNQLAPFYDYNADHGYSGQLVLTVPLIDGGRTQALVAQARDRNSADRVGIEAARREVVRTLVGAWNALATAQRNVAVQTRQLTAARILDDGTFQEYRAGLRSTFDVLFAHSSLRDAEIALVSSHRDLYVAQAALLRRLGLLEVRALLTATPLYDPSDNFRQAEGRATLPWDGAARAIDGFDRRIPPQRDLRTPALPPARPAVVTGPAQPDIAPATHSPNVPVPGTVGVPANRDDELRQ